jgi:hypothetical protein
VHATYTFDGSTGAAKRLRFAEVGLWDPAADAAAAAAEAEAEAGSGGHGGSGGDGVGGGEGAAGGSDVEGGVGDSKELPTLLTFDPAPIVAGLGEKPSIGAHLEGGTRQLAALRDAFAIALVLNRTLVVPRLTCFCDKVGGAVQV